MSDQPPKRTSSSQEMTAVIPREELAPQGPGSDVDIEPSPDSTPTLRPCPACAGCSICSGVHYVTCEHCGSQTAACSSCSACLLCNGVHIVGHDQWAMWRELTQGEGKL